MVQSLTLNAQKRELTGRKVKQLRKQSLIPANLYGKNIESVAVQVKDVEFAKVFSEVGETSIVNLNIDGDSKKHPVLIANVQKNPLTEAPLHIDLRQVVLTEKVKASIPVELVGESPAVKEKSAVIVTTVQELEVEALPTDLPSAIEVDISTLTDVGQSILLQDIKVDRNKITFSAADDTTLVAAQAQAVEAEPEVEEVAPEGDESAAAEAEGDTEKGEESKDSTDTK